ncbi:hypothetical protein ACSQ67_023480 [Phaseolus vulgaris]
MVIMWTTSGNFSMKIAPLEVLVQFHMGHGVISLVLDASLGCVESNQLHFFPLQKGDPYPSLSKMIKMKSARLQVVICLEMVIYYPLARGESAPVSSLASYGPSSRHLLKAGSVTTYTFPFTPLYMPSHQLARRTNNFTKASAKGSL